MFAWEAYEKGADVHLQADPTKLELLHKEYRVKKGDFEQDKKLSILDKVRIQMLLTVALETDINKPLYAKFKIEKLQNCAMYCVKGLLIINSFYNVMVRITLCSAHNRQHNMKVLLKSTLTRLLLTPDWRACKSIYS